MKIKQLSVFLENKTGRLSGVCKILANSNINILNMALAEASDFGVLRIIVKNWEAAKADLESHGFTVQVVDVVAVEVADEPGGLESVLMIIEENELSIDYMYAFPGSYGHTKKSLIIMKFSNFDFAEKLLGKANLNVVSAFDFYKEG